jgi:hypothetical protein
LVSLMLVVGALIAPAPSHAAPPEVTASENPVLIAYPHFTTKDITLTWTLERGSPQANLVVRDGDAVVHNQPLFSETGSTQFTVAFDKIYTAQLVRTFGGQPLGDPLTITTDKPTVEMTCAQRCIKSIDVQPHGGWAQFTIKTSRTAVITVDASTKPPDANGKWANPADVAAFAGTVVPTDSYTPPLANLQPNTTYHYVVRVHVGGHEQVKAGTFKTLTRRVDVAFDEIQMIDDSDGPFDGACDCWVWFGAGNQPPQDYPDYPDEASIASDTTSHPNVDFAITNAPADLVLAVFASDDDLDWYDGFSATGYPLRHDIPASDDPGRWKQNGANTSWEWAGNYISVPLARQGPPWSPGDVDEQFTEPFTVYVNGGALVYNARGTYKVSYE